MKNNTYTFYFAYGSNMNQEQMEYRCQNSRPLGKVSLLGYRFIINSRGVATIIPHNYSTVNGVLWLLNLKHEFTLDYFEGVKKKTYFNMTTRQYRIGKLHIFFRGGCTPSLSSVFGNISVLDVSK